MSAEFICPCCHNAVVVSFRPAPTSVSRPAHYPLEPQQRRPDGSLMPAPMNLERAAAFVIPFGKHKGETIADVAEKDIDYLRWGAKEWDRGLGRAVVFFLEHLDNPPA